jgi:hypothetical protein
MCSGLQHTKNKHQMVMGGNAEKRGQKSVNAIK